MDNPREHSEFYDHRETFDEVIEPMTEKIRKVCEAFKIPHIMVFQTGSIEKGEDEVADVISGGLYTPEEQTGMLIRIAASIIGAQSAEAMKGRIMKMAALIAMDEMRGAAQDTRGEMVEQLREMFAEMGIEDDKVDKPLN